jgi:hypothetical protein
MLLRIAVGLALSRSREHRWRRVAVVCSAAAFMVLVLSATSVVELTHRQDARSDARGTVLSSSPATSDLYILRDRDVWEDRRIEVMWIEPVSPEAPNPTLAPGMDELPSPGEAVMSPELARLTAAHPKLSQRYPRRSVLGWQGVRSGEELVAYVRPPAGRRIGAEAEAVHLSGGRLVGDGPVERISGFASDGVPWFEADEPIDRVSGWPLFAGVLSMLVLPGLVILSVGLAAASGVRSHRFQVLAGLGAPANVLRRLAALESVILATPAFVAMALLWWVVVRRLRAVPLAEITVVPGDLAIPAWLLAATVVASVAVSALLSTLVSLGGRRRSPRPVTQAGSVSRLAMVPLLMSAIAFSVAGMSSGNRAADWNLGGIVLAVAGTPLVVPGILRAVGAALGRSEGVAASLAGRSAQWNPARVARPFVGAAALLVLVLAGLGFIAVAQDIELSPRSDTGGVESAAVIWRQVEDGDLARLDAAIRSGLVVPYSVGGVHGAESAHRHENLHEDPSHSRDLAAGVTCQQLARLLRTTCRGRAFADLPATARRHFVDSVSQATGEGVGSVELVAASDVAGSGTVVVLDRSHQRDLDERVRTAARAELPAARVTSWVAGQPQPSALERWIVAGLLIAGAALALGVLLSVIDRFLADRPAHLHLLNVGVPPSDLTRLEALRFAVPFGVACIVGFSVGLVLCLNMVSPGVAAPWPAIAVTAMLALLAALVGTAAIATLGVKHILREAE